MLAINPLATGTINVDELRQALSTMSKLRRAPTMSLELVGPRQHLTEASTATSELSPAEGGMMGVRQRRKWGGVSPEVKGIIVGGILAHVSHFCHFLVDIGVPDFCGVQGQIFAVPLVTPLTRWPNLQQCTEMNVGPT